MRGDTPPRAEAMLPAVGKAGIRRSPSRRILWAKRAATLRRFTIEGGVRLTFRGTAPKDQTRETVRVETPNAAAASHLAHFLFHS